MMLQCRKMADRTRSILDQHVVDQENASARRKCLPRKRLRMSAWSTKHNANYFP